MKLILNCILFLFCLSFWAQNERPNYIVDFITVKNGLSHNYVTSIVSDQLNMKWIGTENGITKYNGYDFDYIKPGNQFPGLKNENIEVLFTDVDSNIWIGTKSGGLSYFNIKENNIKSFNHILDTEGLGDIRITALHQDEEGHIWIGTWRKGVFVLDFKNEKLIRHYNYISTIYSIKKDHLGQMWFASNKTVYIYNTFQNGLKRLEFDSTISDILPDKNRNTVWISVSNPTSDVLYAYHQVSDTVSEIPTNIFSNFTKRLLLDNQNRIWIGTWGNGVYRSNKDITNFNKIEIINEFSEKIEGNYSTILSIHEDKNNVIWLTTASGGVVKLLEGNGFKNLAQSIGNKEIKEKLNCTSIFKNEDYLFVGTLFSGVYYGKDENNLKHIEAIGNVKINSMYAYKNKLFIGTAEGFSIFDLVKGEFIFTNNAIKKITAFLVQDENLFIGTQQLGVAKTKLSEIDKKRRYEFFTENEVDSKNINGLRSNRITGLEEDQNGNIWASSYNGLHLFSNAENTFVHHSEILENNSVTINIINSLELKGSLLWLSTPNGLIKLNYKNEKLQFQKLIGKKDGLNSDFICSATFDDNLNLWISTHTEIVKYNKADQSITSYGEANGIKTSLFNNNVHFNNDNELIFFGGIDNVTFFDPQSIKNLNVIPEVVFTSLRVKNKKVEFTPEQEIIDQSFNYAKKINLTYKDDFFSIRFVANDFLGKLNMKYKYLLEGYQENWVELQGMNEINFASLAPGKYTLKVQASRDNQNWSPSNVLEIELAGSPWKSNIALFLYFLFTISIISYFLWLNNYRLNLKNKLEIAKLDEKKKVELTEAKLNFFTNISHEFRTPLTLIISPLKELLESDSFSPKVYKSLSYIDKNTTRLLNLINQLLDFRKAEYGLLKLKASHGNFVRFSNEVYLYFKEAAKEKNIRYSYQSKHNEILFPFDRNKLEIVLCNLLSNAIKYTNSGGEITMELDYDSENCIIRISDSGIGMKSKDADKIFDRFFQIESANTASMIGSGIGLSFTKKIIELHHGSISVKSKPNKGTTFTVKLAMDPKQYQGEIDESFLKTDNIRGYNTESLSQKVRSLDVKNDNKQQVLIIDDNAEILNYLSDMLSEEYNVIQAENGVQGCEKALEEIPDLIISDVMMPEKDGITLCKELKTNINTSHIPVILLTARTSTVYEIGGLKNGADDYITKPFDAKVIKARISSLLENREKLRTHFQNKIRFEPTAAEIEQDADAENSFIHKAIVLVENNMDNESFGIDNMVEELNMSRSSLFRKIKSLTGLSLSAFIRSVRLKKAALLILTEEDISLKEVAFQVGFNTYKYFKISFQKQFNCLPSHYKEINQKQK
jgi:signal transduction histidine kinase/DNA-binding response OmpR family regulator/ligand-binding sensor domain-containing protein